MTRSLAALALLLALSLPACARQTPPPDAGTTDPSVGPYAAPGPDGTIRVRTGSEFRIVLNSNATTGRRWQLSDSAALRIVALVRSEYVRDPAPEGMVGSGGQEHWIFRAVAPGETSLAMAYARSWEKGAAAQDTVFRVIVQ